MSILAELLLAADKCHYRRARAARHTPCIAFHVHPDRVVAEYNNDGTTLTGHTPFYNEAPEHCIKASFVSTVAWKTQIQSGTTALSLADGAEDWATDAIEPGWESSGPGSPLTRVTLHLRQVEENGDREEAGDPGCRSPSVAGPPPVREQFDKFPETTLLFLNSLRRVEMFFYDVYGCETSSRVCSVQHPRTNRAELHSSTVSDGLPEETISYFHVTTYHTARPTARGPDKRPLERETPETPPVKLAFPLTQASDPIIAQQHLFAFLRVSPHMFSFLIHADFALDESRKRARDCPVNQSLVVSVADAFVAASLEFCREPSLCFRWIAYLPKRDTWQPGLLGRLPREIELAMADGLNLFAGISSRDSLSVPRSPRRCISSLACVPPSMQDDDGLPLFAIRDSENIISPLYGAAGIRSLRSYRLKDVQRSQVLDWLESDLQSPDNKGRMRQMGASGAARRWQAKTAALLCDVLQGDCFGLLTSRLKAMAILPLESGDWAAASPGPVYFAQIGRLEIPPDTGLRTIARSVTDPQRLALFRTLGVRIAPVELVAEKILEQYAPDASRAKISLSTSQQHLRFLYLTHHRRDPCALSLAPLSIWVQHPHPAQRPADVAVYIANNSSYGIRELVQKPPDRPLLDSGASGDFAASRNSGASGDSGDSGASAASGLPPAFFVNGAYFVDGPPTPHGQSLSWRQWFYKYLSIRDHVQIVRDGKLTSAGQYLQRCKPDKFLGALLVDFQHRKRFDQKTINKLRKTEVLCHDRRSKVSLFWTFFPTTELRRRVSQFMEPGAFFPWVYLDATTIDDSIPPHWESLWSELGMWQLHYMADLDFGLTMLQYTKEAFLDRRFSSPEPKIYALYNHVYTMVHRYSDIDEAADWARDYFQRWGLVYIKTGSHSRSWPSYKTCVWHTPQQNETKQAKPALEAQYKAVLGEDSFESWCIRDLFLSVLQIPLRAWDDRITELQTLRTSVGHDPSTLATVYKDLNRSWFLSTDPDEECSAILDAFHTHSLVYVPSIKAWRTPSQCVWSDPAMLGERASLKEIYPDLERFFVEYLKVEVVDFRGAVDSLEEAGEDRSVSTKDLKETISAVNSFLKLEPTAPSSSKVVAACIFPVRQPDGQITRENMAGGFFVADEDQLEDAFQSKVKLLDFTAREVAQLGPFLEWTGLVDRTLSKRVEKTIAVPRIAKTAKPTVVRRAVGQIQRRAHALLRIARHFASPRTQSAEKRTALLEMLEKFKVHEASKISFHLPEDGETVVAEGGEHTVVVDEDQSGPIAYFKRQEGGQGPTLATLLGGKIFEWMMMDPDTKVASIVPEKGASATRAVLRARSSESHAVLNKRSIEAFSDVDDKYQADSEDSGADSDVDSNHGSDSDSDPGSSPHPNADSDPGYDEGPDADDATTPRTPSRQAPTNDDEQADGTFAYNVDSASDASTKSDDDVDTDTQTTPARSLLSDLPNPDSILHGSAGWGSSSASRSARSARRARTAQHAAESPTRKRAARKPKPPAVKPARPVDNEAYTSLLSHIIAAARAQARGCRGSGADDTARPRLPDGLVDQALNDATTQMGRFKIGAAGELYAFEFLSHLGDCPGFTRDCWKSSIRDLVTGQPDYADMTRLAAIEKCDIEYADQNGILTAFLIQQGKLARDEWEGKWPNYLVEVKTSKLDAKRPFYMTKAQYNLMHRCSESRGRDTIYIVFRVHDLGTADMGFTIYVDPAALSKTEELRFEAATWLVQP